jgi:hypothetical protein
MKKLKLYGEKKIFGPFKKKGFIAEVFVVDGKVVVESKNKKVKEELQKEIDEGIKNDEITISRSVWEEFPEKLIIILLSQRNRRILNF